MLDEITPLVLTYNEEPNIARCLEKLRWAHRVVVLDSFSNDRTLDLIRSFANTDLYQREFDSHAQQWNYGVSLVETDWVLALDADYLLESALVSELRELNLELAPEGYFAPFQYCVRGKPLRSTLLPPREILVRKKSGVYIQDGHTQRWVQSGKSGHLKFFILHDDRKSFSRWWSAQRKYAFQEAEKIMTTSFSELNNQDKLRKMLFFAPGAVFFYCLFYRGLILDGWNGLAYSTQRFLAEMLLSLAAVKFHIKKSKKI